MLGPLHIYCGCLAWAVCGTSNIGIGGVSDSFACCGDTTGIPCSPLHVRVCAYSYCILLSHVQLISLGSCSFLKGNGGAVDVRKRGDGGGDQEWWRERRLQSGCSIVSEENTFKMRKVLWKPTIVEVPCNKHVKGI